MALLRRITALPHHYFWPDDLRIAASPHMGRASIVGHQQVTDAHPAGLAIRHGGCLVTFDRGVRSLVAAESLLTRVAEVVPAEP
jgi:hypothetical protein